MMIPCDKLDVSKRTVSYTLCEQATSYSLEHAEPSQNVGRSVLGRATASSRTVIDMVGYFMAALIKSEKVLQLDGLWNTGRVDPTWNGEDTYMTKYQVLRVQKR